MDLALSSAALILLTLPLLAIAIAVRVRLGSPVLFMQIRPGRGERLFRMIKFRTMTDARDDQGNLLPDAQRLTSLGRWLRATSLDELPELWNVLRGEMSLVGPRPLLVEYLPLYNDEQRLRHSVRPGITGWAQVNGRNALTWSEKFALDVWYVRHTSTWLDLKILWLTLVAITEQRGVSAPGHATMPPFTGNR